LGDAAFELFATKLEAMTAVNHGDGLAKLSLEVGCHLARGHVSRCCSKRFHL
jgi:hypothetical protein